MQRITFPGLANPAIIPAERLCEGANELAGRVSGEPVSKSPITATAAAPLAITSGARSSVIPPMATTGRPAAEASAETLAY